MGPLARGVRGRSIASTTVALVLIVGGCARVESAPPVAPEPAALEGPPIREGLVTQAEAMEAARLLSEGESMLGEGRAREALERAIRVEEAYASVPGSSQALWLRARSARALDDWAQVITAAERYMQIFPGESPERGRGAILRAEAMREISAPGGIEALFELPTDPETPEDLTQIEVLASGWAAGLETSDLRDLTLEAPRHPVVLPVFLIELAVRRFLTGASDEARELAEASLSLTPGPATELRARSVMEGEVDADLEVAGVLGGLLPIGGSPTIRAAAEDIREGIEIALTFDDSNAARPIRFIGSTGAGGATDIAESVRRLADGGAAGMIGPLEDDLLDAAARARPTPFPIVSPTARVVPAGQPGAYSMTGVDPAAGAALARLALNQGVRSVVVLHSSTVEMTEAAQWFRDAYTAAGGSVSRVLTYPVGATSYQTQMNEVIRLRPQGLVLLTPPSDVEMVAPQLSFYGVDDLPGLTVIASEAWTSEAVLEIVPARYTDGILSVTSRPIDGGYGPNWDTFVSAYEEHFQRTLRSPNAALGYDAARLLVAALRGGGGTAAGTLRAMEAIQDFPGATGLLSVVDGRIQRSFRPVRVQNRQVLPL